MTILKGIAFAFLSVFTTVQAQDKVLLGANAGLTYSNFRGNQYVEDNIYGVNFLVGLTGEIPLSSKVAILANLNYERKSYAQDITISRFITYDQYDSAFLPADTYRSKNTQSYLAVPLNIKVYLGNKNNFFINGGPYTAFLLGTSQRIDGKKQPKYGNTSSSVDLGINLGAGCIFRLDEKNRLNLEIRDNLGLANTNTYGVNEFRSNSFNLILNWQFEL